MWASSLGGYPSVVFLNSGLGGVELLRFLLKFVAIHKWAFPSHLTLVEALLHTETRVCSVSVELKLFVRFCAYGDGSL